MVVKEMTNCCLYGKTCNRAFLRLWKRNEVLRKENPRKAKRLSRCVPCYMAHEQRRVTVAGEGRRLPLLLLGEVGVGMDGTRRHLCCCLRKQNSILLGESRDKRKRRKRKRRRRG